VLMATYNGAAHIASQIASVLWQLRVHVDVYIRDDASSDNTIIEAFEAFEAFPGSRLHVIDDFPGPSSFSERGAAVNFYRLIASKRVASASYDWVAFSDQDDIWLPSKLYSAINDCLKSGSLAWSSSVLAFWESPGKTSYIPKHGNASAINFLFESPGPGCTILLRSDVFESLQCFVRAHFTSLLRIEFHDWLIYGFVVKNHGSWFISSRASILYRQHNQNVAGAGMSFAQLRKKLSLVFSGWYRDQILLLSSLFLMDEHPAMVVLRRLSIWDRICLPFVLWPHRRRFKDKLLLFFVLPFSFVRLSTNRVY
jgi:rhamnosyltransferase